MGPWVGTSPVQRNPPKTARTGGSAHARRPRARERERIRTNATATISAPMRGFERRIACPGALDRAGERICHTLWANVFATRVCEWQRVPGISGARCVLCTCYILPQMQTVHLLPVWPRAPSSEENSRTYPPSVCLKFALPWRLGSVSWFYRHVTTVCGCDCSCICSVLFCASVATFRPVFPACSSLSACSRLTLACQ